MDIVFGYAVQSVVDGPAPDVVHVVVVGDGGEVGIGLDGLAGSFEQLVRERSEKRSELLK